MDAACAVKHSVVASPLGQIRISGCQQGLHEIKLPAAGPPEAPARPEPPGRPAETVKPLTECAAWLHAYFQEPAALRELPLPALHHPVFLQDSFTGQVLRKLLEAVKFGEVVSYQQLAALAGHPKAARAVGSAMRSNPVPILVPCHRVVCSGGAVGNYSGGLGVKEWLLDHEGSLAAPPAPAGGSRLARTRCGALRGSSSSECAGGD
ncbi:methylated-DNA--protein-cysteine methyltransferase isoform X2 [Pipistrellus kuhlii]|uniref:Methylated-DNA--protein-cysteine methyltransferase n=2 Tax=Pipistrellus kuhlii TaxID=59472 RepID=A0A7J7VBT1_PIPKU|nr:methylated-DNA--protein-cysteine methyltransferase isoform X2 [Pipistrellus kuhlii]KAF6322574.1 O-6-methylguanine-DNA methyltransferase [Pipistrellus kuhlii]